MSPSRPFGVFGLVSVALVLTRLYRIYDAWMGVTHMVFHDRSLAWPVMYSTQSVVVRDVRTFLPTKGAIISKSRKRSIKQTFWLDNTIISIFG